MKAYFTVILLFTFLPLVGQFKNAAVAPVRGYELASDSRVVTSKRISAPGLGLIADKQSNYRLPQGYLVNKAYNLSAFGPTYWAGAITTQSYNRGKIGMFYFWDLQGNLRESKFFLDIAGRNKRGLKLVIPRK